MARTISIGAQGFEDLRKNGYFYMGKTGFVRDWWASGDPVSLVYHPRRFGKTLNLDTVPRDHHKKVIDEQVVFSELYTRPNAVWALLLAADYVTAPGDVHTVIRAWEQIEERAYVAGLVARGIAPERIRTYSIAFCGKDVLVG